MLRSFIDEPTFFCHRISAVVLCFGLGWLLFSSPEDFPATDHGRRVSTHARCGPTHLVLNQLSDAPVWVSLAWLQTAAAAVCRARLGRRPDPRLLPRGMHGLARHRCLGSYPPAPGDQGRRHCRAHRPRHQVAVGEKNEERCLCCPSLCLLLLEMLFLLLLEFVLFSFTLSFFFIFIFLLFFLFLLLFFSFFLFCLSCSCSCSYSSCSSPPLDLPRPSRPSRPPSSSLPSLALLLAWWQICCGATGHL